MCGCLPRAGLSPAFSHCGAQFLDKFEHKFVAQGDYESRDIFGSLDLAWSLLRTFPRESLKRINIKTLDEFCTCSRGGPCVYVLSGCGSVCDALLRSSWLTFVS